MIEAIRQEATNPYEPVWEEKPLSSDIMRSPPPPIPDYDHTVPQELIDEIRRQDVGPRP